MSAIKFKIGDTWSDLVLDLVYPVGSLYMSINSTSPAILFGGSWAAIENRMIIGASTTYAVGNTGGSATTIISSANLPTHVHSVGAHSHGLNSHTHSIPKHGHTYTQPTVSSSGYVKNGIPSAGDHSHTTTRRTFYADNANDYVSAALGGSGAVCKHLPEYETTNTKGAHTHNLPNHTHTLTGGSVADKDAFTSGQASGSTANSTAFDTGNGGFANTAMTTISPYYSAYIWRRTA